MAGTNKFFPNSTAAGAKVMNDADYLASDALSLGAQIGELPPEYYNKVNRQTSIMVSMIGQFIVDMAGVDANDSQSVATLENNFKAALAAYVQSIGLTTQNIKTIAAPVPIYPEITTNNGAFVFSSGVGQITLAANQSWQWRSLASFNSGIAQTFATVASKIYHLIWDAPGTGNATPAANYPNGYFALVDRTAASPVETDPSYDSTYDRMLCARIVTDGSNNPTITPLFNKQLLAVSLSDNVSGGISSVAAGKVQPAPTDTPRIIFDNRSPANGGDGAGRAASQFSYNWARTPKIAPASAYVGFTGQSANASVPYTYQEGGSKVTSKTVSRYSTILQYQTDYNLAGIADGNGNLVLTGMFAGAFLDVSANG